jgi:hypothetical protein
MIRLNTGSEAAACCVGDEVSVAVPNNGEDGVGLILEN